MSGYNLILQIRRLEEECEQLGLMMCHSRYGGHRDFGDVVAVKAKDQDSLPIYARDAELFVGTLTDLGQWLKGIRWAREYDAMLFGRSHNQKRERKEQDWRNQQLLRMVKTGQE